MKGDLHKTLVTKGSNRSLNPFAVLGKKSRLGSSEILDLLDTGGSDDAGVASETVVQCSGATPLATNPLGAPRPQAPARRRPPEGPQIMVRLLGGRLGLVVGAGEAGLLRPVLREAEGTVAHPLTRLVPALLAPVLLDAGVGPEVGDLRNRSPVGVNKAPGDLPIRVPFYEFLVDLERQKGHKSPLVIYPRWPKISVYQRSPRPPVWPWRFFSQTQVFTLMCRKFIPLRAILLKQSQSSQ